MGFKPPVPQRGNLGGGTLSNFKQFLILKGFVFFEPEFRIFIKLHWRRTLVHLIFIQLPFSFGEGARRADEASFTEPFSKRMN